MKLSSGAIALALKLQESGDDLSANDIAARLRDCIADCYRGSGTWAYYVDHFGDSSSGDVIYSCDSDMYRASYSMADVGGAAKCVIDFQGAEDVVPRTIYEKEMEEEDHYAAMEESYKAEGFTLPMYERFISKDERKSASAEDFAGKGRSFPILKPEDVMAAARSLGRAGSDNKGTSAIKAAIIRIANRKGWGKYLPKAWQGGGTDAKESAELGGQSNALILRESAAFAADITITEALAPGKQIKLIAPGKGSTAYYTREALQKAATDRVFHAGLPMRIDHPTRAEEAARPEGSVKDWGAVLAEDAVWRESYVSGGKDLGPGLYSSIKPFSDHARTIEEKGPYAGVSIRANGAAVVEAGRPVMRDGVPLLKEFTSAEGADMVTRAGAGGLFLSESATTHISTEEVSMTEAEAKQLIEAATAPLRARALRGDAQTEAARLLKDIDLPQASKTKVIEASIREIPTTASGELDTEKLRECVVRESQAEAGYLESVARELGINSKVRGMGAPAAAAPRPEDIAAREAAAKREYEEDVALFESMGMPHEAAVHAAKGRAA